MSLSNNKLLCLFKIFIMSTLYLCLYSNIIYYYRKAGWYLELLLSQYLPSLLQNKCKNRKGFFNQYLWYTNKMRRFSAELWVSFWVGFNDLEGLFQHNLSVNFVINTVCIYIYIYIQNIQNIYIYIFRINA